MADKEKNVSVEKSAKAAKPSIVARTKKWVRELKGEVKKIVWPSREQTTNNTMIVLVCCLMVGAFIWIVDAIFSLGIQSFISLF